MYGLHFHRDSKHNFHFKLTEEEWNRIATILTKEEPMEKILKRTIKNAIQELELEK